MTNSEPRPAMSWLHLERGISLYKMPSGKICLGPITVSEAAVAEYVLHRLPRDERNTFRLLKKITPLVVDDIDLVQTILNEIPGAVVRPDIYGERILFVPDLRALELLLSRL